MSKKKKSKFTKTDVNTICEMQRKIDAYESYIIGFHGLLQKRGSRNYVVLLRGTEMDDWVNGCWKMVNDLIDDAYKTKAAMTEKEFQEQLSEWERGIIKYKGED